MMSILEYKNKIVGSVFLLSCLSIVFFVVLDPADSSRAVQVLSNNSGEADLNDGRDSTQLRPELVAVSTKTQRLEESMGTQKPKDSKNVNPITQEAGVGKTETKTVAVGQTTKKAPPKNLIEGWFVQLGVFKTYSNAELLEVEVRNIGYNTQLADEQFGQKSLTKLLVGPYSTKTLATSAKTKLEKTGFGKKHGIEDMFVVRTGSKT